MRIVHLVTQSKIGGAAIASKRLNNALNQCGIDSSIISIEDTSIYYQKIKYPILYRINKKIIPQTLKEYGLFSYANYGYDLMHNSKINDADIIYIHWINGLLSLKNIDKLCSLGKPVIIFLHDMWHLTGGCHHSFECTEYKKECKKCPAFFFRNKLPQKQLEQKKKIFDKYSNITIVTPSNWLTKCAKESTLFANKNIITIKNCIDTSIFKYVDKVAARKFLNLPIEKKIICFGAHKATENPYKGWSYLVKALNEFSNQDFSIMVFGESYNKEIVDSLPFETYFSGYINDEPTMALLYNAVDLFVMPSLAESFGMVAVEALACNTPVVGFDTGGIPDIIEKGKRGYLAVYKDSADLAEGIRQMLCTPISNCKDWIYDNCSYKEVGNKHIELCNSLLSLNNKVYKNI